VNFKKQNRVFGAAGRFTPTATVIRRGCKHEPPSSALATAGAIWSGGVVGSLHHFHGSSLISLVATLDCAGPFGLYNGLVAPVLV
jgi:hypothetical protein